FLMQLGTLSGNPVAAVAGMKTMEILRRPGQYDKLRGLGKTLMGVISEHLGKAGFDHQIVGDPTLFDVLFTSTKINDYRDVYKADAARNLRFNKLLREKGIFKAPGKLYPCLALTDADIEQTIDAVAYAAGKLD
ncbi:MAG: aspartate aminotransferase family protein, partial [Pseudomonadota bacterium]